ncbi:PepSY domain-containing protein [Massilia agilis]|uniref:PepSY domain-containing protein n=1 Tax=Massilia agilis TaxID=1811226 RepID=A0ABT2DAQ1_9BURK|nr:PepSY-associated TM helix domain-containing protein [Massilia agilis]MCS0808385.1 PepSY domain-containing protein [Massilia agilis]
MASPVRRVVLALHFWSGLVVGLWFVLLGLTGSALVFYLDIDRALNPHTRVEHAVAALPPVESIHQALRQAYPERDGPWRIELPLDQDTPVMARYYHPAERAGSYFAPMLVTLDPATLQVTSKRFWGDTVVTWLFDLHYTLLLGKPGLVLVGLAGILCFAVMVTGIQLWWPSKARFWTALRIVPRPGAVRRAYDMHCSSGVYWLPLLAVLALTGSALAFPDQTRLLLRASPAPAAPITSAHQRDTVSLDQAIATAKARFPDAEVRWVETSGAGHTPISLRMRQPSEPSRRFPQTRVWLDAGSGAILAAHDPLAANTGARMSYWFHPLHNGEAFGIVGRAAVFLSGFVPLLLFVTGVIRWRHKVRARAQAARTARPLTSAARAPRSAM